MTRDDVILMAREAGFEISCERSGEEAFIQVPLSEWGNSTMLFERFAKLVAQQEREACAKICSEISENSRYGQTYAAGASCCSYEIRLRSEKEFN